MLGLAVALCLVVALPLVVALSLVVAQPLAETAAPLALLDVPLLLALEC
jgi:hypothetical protein